MPQGHSTPGGATAEHDAEPGRPPATDDADATTAADGHGTGTATGAASRTPGAGVAAQASAPPEAAEELTVATRRATPETTIATRRPAPDPDEATVVTHRATADPDPTTVITERPAPEAATPDGDAATVATPRTGANTPAAERTAPTNDASTAVAPEATPDPNATTPVPRAEPQADSPTVRLAAAPTAPPNAAGAVGPAPSPRPAAPSAPATSPTPEPTAAYPQADDAGSPTALFAKPAPLAGAATTTAPPDAPKAPDAPEPAAPATPRRRRRALLVTGGAVAALALLYGGDLVVSSGSVPRGVTVEGVPVGGLALADADAALRAQIEPRTTRAVPVTVGDAKSAIDPKAAGLTLDWTATLARVDEQPLNPITRVTSFFTTREIGVVTHTDPAAMDAALAELKPAVDRPAVEGSIRFDGTTPRPVPPVPGQELDTPAAAAALTRDWASGAPVALPLTPVAPLTSTDDVTAALEKTAKPAVAGPVTITGENNTEATLAPKDIAAALTFRPDATAGLVPQLNQDALATVLKPQLAASEIPGRDATFDFASGTPVVVPSQDGRGVDYPATINALLPVLTAPAPRQLAAIYADQPAKLTTEGLSKLGITGVIGEFTTRGFAADSGMNIKRAAQQINGAILRPGETFSLNAATNPRDAAHGYVEAGIIEDGHPARGIGGGVSQVATTLYNASYFAGMTEVEHREHSFYISRYPAGREATVFDNVIDLKFRNDNPTAVMIQTVWAPGSITVRIYGTKVYDVTSTPGPRTDPTEPKTVTIPEGEACTPSKGAPGFTTTDTRTLREISTGKVRTETRTVRYNPSPIIECGGDQ